MAYQPELEKLERRYDEDPARHFAQLAEAYRKGGRHDEALGLLREHLADRPNYVSGLIVLGRCLLDQKNDAEARETFERVLAVDAEHIIALRALGEIGERTGDVGGARGWYQRLLDIDPMNDEAQAALARLPAEGARPTVEEAARPVTTADTATPGTQPAAGAAEAVEAAARREAAAAAEHARVQEAAKAAERAAAEAADKARAEAAAERAVAEAAEKARAQAAAERARAAEAAAAAAEEPRTGERPGMEFTEADTAELLGAPPAGPGDFVIERTSAERGSSPIDWGDDDDLAGDTTIALPEDDERVIDIGELGSVQGAEGAEGESPSAWPPAESAGAGAPGPDSADWLEHPDEPISFAELEAESPQGDEAPPDDLAVEAFDESLGWGAGERVSRQLSAADLDEAEHAHADDLAIPVQDLPGLEDAAPPTGDEVEELAAAAHVEGLQEPDTEVDAEPVEGLENVEHALFPPSDGEQRSPPPASVEPFPEPEPEPFRDRGLEVESEPEPLDLASEGRTSLDGLPVFFPPDDDSKGLQVEPEPEPVVTETMAELYLRQGLLSEARETYRQLLAHRPHDRRLAARLAELDQAGPSRDARTVYAASATGGQAARVFLVEILTRHRASVSEVTTHPSGAAVGSEGGGEGESVELEPMEEAFVDDDETAPRGEPTQPAKDELSLAAIFGDAPRPPAPPPPPAAPDDSERSPGGFSFDDFFAGGAPESDAENPRAPRDTLADDEGDEAFRDWLKGLKS